MFTEFFQLYDHLGIFPDRDNPYVYHLKNINDNFDIGGNILEIGCGAYPSLAFRIAREQIRIGKGTVTAYDPKLVTTNPEECKNLKLVPEKFTPEVSIKNYDLIIGIMPCLVTDSIIEALNITPKDFYISFCSCDHYYVRTGKYLNGEYTSSYIKDIEKFKLLCKNSDLGDMVISSFPFHFSMDTPYIYNKRKIYI